MRGVHFHGRFPFLCLIYQVLTWNSMWIVAMTFYILQNFCKDNTVHGPVHRFSSPWGELPQPIGQFVPRSGESPKWWGDSPQLRCLPCFARFFQLSVRCIHFPYFEVPIWVKSNCSVSKPLMSLFIYSFLYSIFWFIFGIWCCFKYAFGIFVWFCFIPLCAIHVTLLTCYAYTLALIRNMWIFYVKLFVYPLCI